MQKVFRLNNDGDTMTVDINENKKVNIQVNNEEINFFLGNPAFNNAEMEYLLNFLKHELADSMAYKIYNQIGALIGHPIKNESTTTDLFGDTISKDTAKRRYAKRTSKYRNYYIRVYDKTWNVVFERTNTFYTMADARRYAYDAIRDSKVGMKSRVVVKKA